MASRFAVPTAVGGRLCGVLLAGLIAACGSLTECEAGAIPAAHDARTPDSPNEPADPVTSFAAQIDRQVAARWAEEQVEPAPTADDAEFLRRTFLNVAGRIPSCSEVQSFLEETRPDKRRWIVDRLLESPAYPTHFAGVLRTAIVPEANTDPQLQFQGAAAFDQWMRRRIAENAGYDRIARELLMAPVGMPGPGFYFVAKGGKPENIAAGAARVFLGLRIECAQCHNHPFAKWRREQFWQFAAFFAGIDRPPNGRIGEDARLAELKIPGLDKVVQARFLDDAQGAWSGDRQPREALANWITAPRNAYFARAAVNRISGAFLRHGDRRSGRRLRRVEPAKPSATPRCDGRRFHAAEMRREIPDSRDLREPALSIVQLANGCPAGRPPALRASGGQRANLGRAGRQPCPGRRRV